MRKESHLGSRREAQAGFTLIEMSIVLVIIGLIVGGVLKGQELIDGARQKSTVAQVDGFRVAVSTFQDKYNQMPGDFTAATVLPNITTQIGNGDGVVGTVTTPLAITAGAAAVADENQLFWHHLAGAQLITAVALVPAAASLTPGVNTVPLSKFSGAGFSVSYSTVNGVTDHWFRLHRGTATPAGVFSGKQAFEIDSKYDDGVANAGQITAPINAAACVNGAAYTPTDTTNGCAGMAFCF